MNGHSHEHDDSLQHDHSSNGVAQKIVENSLWIELLFSRLGAFLNIFHLIVLTRKPMRTSSTNVIMTGIAFCDLFLMVIVIRSAMIEISPAGSDCSPPSSLLKMRIDWFLVSAHLCFRQCSAWLAVFISFLTYRIITDITNQSSKFTRPVYGYKTVIVAFSLSVILSLINFWHHKFVEVAKWYPKTTCVGYSGEVEVPIYAQECQEILSESNGLLARIRMLFEGVVVKLIPCILLPTLTGLLIYEMRKTARTFANTVISVSRKDARKSRQDRTTLIVIFIAFTFLLSELPIGIFETIVAIWHDDPVIQGLTKIIGFVTDCVFTVNASIHCVICFSMSLQYRTTVKSLLRWPCSKKTPEVTVQNGTKISSSHHK